MKISSSVGIECHSLTDDLLGLKFWRLTLMAFLRIVTLLLWLLVGAGADCGLDDCVFKCWDICGEEVRDASSYRRLVTFVGLTLFLDCVGQADLKGSFLTMFAKMGITAFLFLQEVKLVLPTVCVRRRVDMDRVVMPWRWCKEVVPPKPEISTAAVPPVVEEPCPVAPTANLAVVHVPASKTPFVVRAPPLRQQSVGVAHEVPHVIKALLSTPKVTVNIKHGVAHVEADVDLWTAMVLVFMGLGGAGATSLAVFLVWLVKFIRDKMAFLRILVLLVVGVAAAGADCGPEDGVFVCWDVCGKEVRGAGGYGPRVTFVGATLFLDCVRQADLKEVKLLSPTVCVRRRSEMDRVVTPWRWCEEVVPPEPEVSTAAVPPVVDEPCPVAPTANLVVVHMPASKTPFMVRAPPSTQQSVVVAQKVPHVIKAPSSTPEVTVNIKHGVAHVEADVDPWTAMVLVFMGLGGAGATSLAVFLVWLVKFIRNKMAFLKMLVLLIVGVAAAGADCGPEDSVFKCRDVCGEEVRDAGGYGRRVTFVGSTLFLDCVHQADLKEVKLVSPTVCIGRRVDMDRVVTPWRWCKEVVPPEPEISTAAVPPVVDEPRPVAPTANLAVVHVPVSKTLYVVWAPPSTQQSVMVAQEVPHVIRAPSSTPEVMVNIKHGVAHVEADVDPWTAMVLVFMGLGGAGATSLAVFLVWLVKFIRNKISGLDPQEFQHLDKSLYMRELVQMLTPEDQQDPEAQPVVDLLGLEETDKPVEEKKEEELVLEDNNPFKEMLNA
ncbi:unnamed protein product [Notodromas monacha]|uniref:Uncharacterized protein n=1 Tax=Notodromas monacha TaxID=399045 RepID=A0A7R9BZ15_9CRUS|nr:unnamed protein product [Notodromas monacha]CAG0924364.1 unnamed protein product [Notodromas monacha]